MTSTTNVPTRIIVLSDTHSALPDPINKPWLKFSHKLPQADVAIHCGDLTSCGKLHEHERAIALLKSLPAPVKIVIPGNHDMTLDPAYLEHNRYLHGWNRPHTVKDSQEAMDLYTSREAKEAGIIYVVEGLHSFTLPNGAKLTLYASAFTPEFCNWGFAYPRSQDRFNVHESHIPDNSVPSFSTTGATNDASSEQVTVMVTHGPPRGILDRTINGESVGCDHLLTAVSRCRPLLHCFGHIHEAWGAEIRLWSDQAENGGTVGSERAALRSSSMSERGAQNGNGTGDGAEQSGVEARVYQAACTDKDAKSEVGSEVCKISVSHPKEAPDVAMTDPDGGIQNVSVIDARAVEYGKQTVFVNASIMDVRYVPRQWPWLVQIGLPRASEEEVKQF